MNEGINTTHQNVWDKVKAILRKDHCNQCLYQETAKATLNKLTVYLKKLEKQTAK